MHHTLPVKRALRRVLIELTELLVSAHFVPALLVIGAVVLFIVSLFFPALTGTWTLSVSAVSLPHYTTTLSRLFINATILVYGCGTLWRLIRPTTWWWSVRRKTALALSGTLFLYMVLFAALRLQQPTTDPVPWVYSLCFTIGWLIYTYGVRYVANKCIRSIKLPDVQSQTTAQPL